MLRTANLCKLTNYFVTTTLGSCTCQMIPYQQQAIPDWLQKEVEQYFIPLPFEPTSIVDIGANIGAFAQRAHQQWPAAHIYCYEPMPFNLIQLRRNAPNGTTVVSAAVRAQSGLDEIFIGDNFVTGGFSQIGRQTQKKLLVECIAATEVPAADLVKIDTEGSEVEILQSLSVETTKAILLEYHSLDDSRRIRELLAPQFHLAYEHGEGQLGTYIFIRN